MYKDTLFDLEELDKNENKKTYAKVRCDRCDAQCDAYYTLSSKTKGLWVKCKNCGNHAMSYITGLNIRWKPSKTFIKEVGIEKATTLAREKEENKGKSDTQSELPIGGQKKASFILNVDPNKVLGPKLYCDAGTRNNGQKGRQETIIVVCDETGKILQENWIGDYSNNEGEIQGIIDCLQKYSNNKSVTVFTDSQIAHGWAVNGWTSKHQKRLIKGKLSERHKAFIELANQLYIKSKAVIAWIPRKQNLAGNYIEKKTGL